MEKERYGCRPKVAIPLTALRCKPRPVLHLEKRPTGSGDDRDSVDRYEMWEWELLCSADGKFPLPGQRGLASPALCLSEKQNPSSFYLIYGSLENPINHIRSHTMII